jgi:hypothetical protein
MNKEQGVLIEKIDVQPVVEKAAQVNREWEYSEIVSKLNAENKVIYDRFFQGVPTPGDEARLPYPLISVDNLRNLNTLAAYQIVPDEYGFNRKIILNEQHFIEVDGKKVWRYGDWALRESLTHEDAHDWQQLKGKTPFKSGKSHSTHNPEFIQKMEDVGLHPMPGVGCHTQVGDADKAFGILMKEWGYPRPEEVTDIKGKVDWFEWDAEKKGKDRKGTSTLDKWSCGCQNARIGAKEFHAVCTKCNNPFIKVEAKATAVLGMTIPEKKKTFQEPKTKEEYQAMLDDEMKRRRAEDLDPLHGLEDYEDLGDYMDRNAPDYGEI